MFVQKYVVSSLPHEEHHLKAQKDGMGNHREPKLVFTKDQKEEEEEEEQKLLKEKHEFLEFFYTLVDDHCLALTLIF